MSDIFPPSTVPPKQAKLRSAGSATMTVSEDHVFEIPAKLIKTPADMKIWEKSEAYFEYLGFILAINEAVKGKSNSQGSENVSETAILVVGLLDKFDAMVDETPPVQQPQRFGNTAFRTWYQKMRDGSLILLQDILKLQFNKSLPEVVTYLVEAFGNQTRIDYGTGHEISFIMFLCCLFKIGLMKDTDKVATGCYIFPRYLDLVRKLQKTYRMEPAGSHGVWSLDDHQFVPFIWGSSQLFAHPTIEPVHFLNDNVLKEHGDDYMFLSCIQYINSVKTGPFAEHSNQLWSISGVSSWSKINSGLIKMYKAEVLSKFPVVQHIVFGSLFTLRPMEQSTGMMTPKFTMEPPPARSSDTSIYSRDSTSSSKRSSISSRASMDKEYTFSPSNTSSIVSKGSEQGSVLSVELETKEAGSSSIGSVETDKSTSASVTESVRFTVASEEPRARGVRAGFKGPNM